MPDGEVSIQTVLADKIVPYAINVAKDDHVSAVSLKVEGNEVTEAVAGQTVVVELSFEEKYILLDIVANDGALSLTPITEGLSYSFVMPEGVVSLNVTSEKVVETHRVNKVTLSSSLIESFTGVAEGAEVLAGETVNVELKFKSQSSYKIDGAIYVNGELIKLTADENTANLYKGSFVMPDEDAEIVATHLMKQVGVDAENSVQILFEQSDLYTIYGIENGGYYDPQNYSQAGFALIKKKGVLVNKISINEQGSSSAMSIYSSYSYEDIYNVSCYMFSDKGKVVVELKVEAEEVGVKNVTFVNGENAVITGNTEVTPGDKATFTIKGAEGYVFDGVKSVETESGKTLDTWSDDGYTYSSGVLTLKKMPKENIIVTLNLYKAIPVEVEENEFVESCRLALKSTSYWGSDTPTESVLPGRTLVVTPVAITGYAIKSVLVNGVAATKGSSGKFEFAVPEDTDATSFKVTFEIQQYHSVTYTEGEGFVLSKLYTTSALEGTLISFDVKENAGYKVTAVKISSSDEALVVSGASSYSFTMPNADVVITVETTTVPTHALTLDLDEKITYKSVTDKYGTEVTDFSNLNEGGEYTLIVRLPNGHAIDKGTLAGADLEFELTSSYWREYKTTFVVGSADSTLKLTLVEQAHNEVEVKLSESSLFTSDMVIKDKDSGDKITDLTKCYVGHNITVDLTLTADAKSTYKLDSNSFKVTNADGEDVAFTVTASGLLQFTMVDSKVTVTVTPTPIPLFGVHLGEGCEYVVLVGNYSGWGYPSDTDTSIFKEDKSFAEGVKITAYLKKTDDVDGSKTYTFKAVAADGTVLKEDAFSYKGDYWSFSMPAQAVTITVTVL